MKPGRRSSPLAIFRRGLEVRFVFRVDASARIGTGHVVRCASLASHLARSGHEVFFLCREDKGNLNAWLEGQGFAVFRLSSNGIGVIDETQDARTCREALTGHPCDWLIVDHYDLGEGWEKPMRGLAPGLFAIDDVGRAHDCDILLDQNYASPFHASYRFRTPANCAFLLGPEFALLREEFSAARPASLARQRTAIRKLLVFLSGADPDNETVKALNGIAQWGRPDLEVDVVVGGSNPHLGAIKTACAALPNAKLHVQTQRIAELMAAADCAVGACGTNTWERCALGLPALVVILAENQVALADAVAGAGAHRVLGWHHALTATDYVGALDVMDGVSLTKMSKIAAEICDGLGVARVAAQLSSGLH